MAVCPNLDQPFASMAEETTVIILERDGSLSYHPPDQKPIRRAQTSLAVLSPDELPTITVIERLLSFAFDMLGASRLEVRVDER